MTPAALQRLLAWLSPSFPVGAYTYSHGLEWAIEDGTVANAADLSAWLEEVLVHGGGRNDAILFAHAWRAAADAMTAASGKSPNSPPPSSRRRSATSRPPPRVAPFFRR